MALTIAEKTDITNIVLMIVSCFVAMILPFEVFLFSYAILGPLHYLTEISWLHDKKYYTKERYDAIILIIVGILLTFQHFDEYIDIDFPPGFDGNLMYIALLSAVILVTVKNKLYRIGGLVLVVFTSQVSKNFALFFTVFLPTLVHVYLFTGLFMLYGALKSKSRFGIPAVIALALCPVVLSFLFPNTAFYPPTDYARKAYDLFKIVNINWLVTFNHIPLQPSLESWNNIVFHSSAGIILMRFIAFAYTYHYLNWFSKTKIIQWHQVPKARFAAVILIWVASIALYLTDYNMGLQWLLFLSFLHVLLEFPLNAISVIGIGAYFKDRIFKPSAAKA